MSASEHVTHLLGVDVGGTVTKAALFDLDGRQVAVAAASADASTPHPRWLERDMDDAWSLCASAIRRCLEQAGVDPAAVGGVGIAGHNDGLYLVDAAHRPVRPAILAPDSRAHAIVDAWQADGRREQALPIAGLVPGPGSPAPLVAWLAEHEPEALQRTRWILCCKDWLRLRLTGEVATDETDAATLFTAVRSRRYEPRLLELFGLPDVRGQLPPIHGSSDVVGAVTAEAAAETGLAPGTPVVAGAHDVDCGAIGVGAVADEQLTVMAGTWAINELPAADVRLDPRWEARPFVLPDRWMHMGTSPASASALEWFLRELGPQGADRFERVGAEVAAVLEDPADVLFHPFLYGSPHGSDASAAFLGVRGWHRRGHLLRALFEGVVANHRDHVDALRTQFSPRGAARLSGGGARSPIWAQMFADGLNLPVEVPDADEAGARGAAVLAGLGVGLWPDLAAACEATVRVQRSYAPDADGVARFDAIHDRYTRAREALAGLEGA